MTANLGTHTFFMIFLPILFWCGWTSIGRGYESKQSRPSSSPLTFLYSLVHLLAAGVFFSGFVKDLLCLPRPLSPPLARITMSGYAALEYGFPSTHSTNAVSVAVYALLHLRSSTNTLAPALRTAFEILAYSYATSIVVGRLYCGMHGFFDVIVGSILGAGLGLIDYLCIDMFDKFVLGDSIKALLIVILIILVLIRIHPEPADDCPCFDDSVAFAGVVCGIEFGHWHFAQTTYSWNTPVPATTPFDFAALGWVKAVARMCLGILSIIVWKESAKPILLKILPPIFRIFEHVGLILPRKFFKQAS